MHYKHLRPAMQFYFKTFQLLSYTYAQYSRATAVRLDCVVNWHVFNQISFEVSLSFKLFVYYRELLVVICLKMFENERRKGIFS